MRLSLLLVLVVSPLLVQQASAQHEFHTALGRHLGWGSGPGYHTYSQHDVHAWSTYGHPHAVGCTTCTSCAPLPAMEAFPAVEYDRAPISADGQPVVSEPQYYQPLPPPDSNGYPTPAGPQLTPPFQYRQPAAPPVFRSPANRSPTPAPPAPAAVRLPVCQPQFAVRQSETSLVPAAMRQPENLPQYGVRQQEAITPPHFANPLITPTGAASRYAPQFGNSMPTSHSAAIPQPMRYQVVPANTPAGWANAYAAPLQ